jgi:D-psicose/D-tagatose/L-ribulose 3-epimerase
MGKIRYGAYAGGFNRKPIEVIEAVKDLGFDLLEVSVGEKTPDDPKKLRSRLKDAGLGVIASTGCPPDKDLTSDDPKARRKGVEFMKMCVDTTSELGASHMVGLLYSTAGRTVKTLPDDRYARWAAEGLKEVAIYAKKAGLTLGFETVNHYETIINNTVDQCIRFREMVGEPNFMIHLDTFHMNLEEESLYEATKKALPYCCHYHFAEGNRGQVGKGTVDWHGVYRALAEGNYSGTATLEAFADAPQDFRVLFHLWRRFGDSTEASLREGLAFVKRMEREHYT